MNLPSPSLATRQPSASCMPILGPTPSSTRCLLRRSRVQINALVSPPLCSSSPPLLQRLSCRGASNQEPFQASHKAPNRRCVSVKSAAAASAPSEGSSSDPVQSLARFAAALYQFSRPHTMIGTTISIISISMLAIQGTQLTPAMITGLAQALVAALLMNISIVGTNQLYDIEIDKINKPYLPLASGEFSVATGLAVVLTVTAASLLVGWASGSTALMATLVISLLLGLAYSMELPFMRWKRSPLLAAGCILCIRAIAVQLGFYWHMRHCMPGPDMLAGGLSEAIQQLPIPVIFTCGFMLLFSVVIALFKDIPDAEGDSGAGVRTLTVQHGVAGPFWSCIWILTAAYIGACGYSVVSASMLGPMAAAGAPASMSLVPALPVKTLVSIIGHCVLAFLLWWRALKVDLTQTKDITACYMHVWKLFYAEYILIPFFA